MKSGSIALTRQRETTYHDWKERETETERQTLNFLSGFQFKF